QADKRLDHEETDPSLSVVSSPLTGTRCIRPPDEPVGPGASAEAIARHRSAPPSTGPGGRAPGSARRQTRGDVVVFVGGAARWAPLNAGATLSPRCRPRCRPERAVSLPGSGRWE